MMNVLAISDLHGYLPEIPECDLLLLGGDYCPTRNLDQERRFLLGPFSDWLKNVKARYKVAIAGNHDFILQEDPSVAAHLPCIYLQDSAVELEGVTIYGTPWVPIIHDWAFMKFESELNYLFKKIPRNLNILLSHGPAYRHLDKVDTLHVGSFSLWEQVKDKKPDSHVFGHVHEGRGIMDDGDTRFFNVTHVENDMQTMQYEPRYGPVNIPLRVK